MALKIVLVGFSLGDWHSFLRGRHYDYYRNN